MEQQKWWQLVGGWAAGRSPGGTVVYHPVHGRHRLPQEIGDSTKRAPDGRFFVVAAAEPTVGDWIEIPPPV